MARAQTWTARRTRLMHRVHARLASRVTAATGFVSQPEPRTIGLFARGKQLMAGNYLFAGHLIEAPEKSIWDITPPDDAYAEALQGFTWLDDLAAVSDIRARDKANMWVMGWVDRFGNGAGPGWTPELTGRRLIRLINHATFTLRGRDKDISDRFYQSLTHQAVFLSRRWSATRVGIERFEALTGMIYAGLSLIGMEKHVGPAVRALSKECATRIDAEGGLATRNPEELLEVLTLLVWAADALENADRPVPAEHRAAIERIVPTLRALRHSDGSLARFHGGGRGLEGRLDMALAASGVKTPTKHRLNMGYKRMSAGRTSIVVDASAPAIGKESNDAHASTLAFELTSGRRPVIVNCGSGRSFGEEWRRAGRATPSHSTLGLDGYSSSRLAPPNRLLSTTQEYMINVPQRVSVEQSLVDDAIRMELFHDGYIPNFGLTHGRTIEMSVDGRAVVGEDYLAALTKDDHLRFDRALDRTSLQGIAYSIRFHLHPDVDVSIDLGGAAVSLAAKSGEIWVFRHDGCAKMTVEPSVYLENGRLRPRAAQQVVLTGRAMSYATRVRWSLAKAQDTPNALRDLVQDETLMDLDVQN